MATILVVDDETEIREVLAEHLAYLGYGVRQAAGCSAALAVLADEPVTLLLTDLRMPCCSGTQLATEAHRLYPALRVLMMTGYSVNGEAWPVLRKPFRLLTLSAAVTATLAGLPVVV